MNASATMSRMLKPAAVAMATAAALFAFAFAAPSNASAYEIQSDDFQNKITLNNETGVLWADVLADPKLKYAETSDFNIVINGTCSFADLVDGTNVSVVNSGSDPAKVTFNKGIHASEDLDLINKTGANFTIIAKASADVAAAAEDKGEFYSPVTALSDIYLNGVTLTSTGGIAAIFQGNTASFVDSTVTATGDSFGLAGSYFNITRSTVTAKGKNNGIATDDVVVNDSKVTATGTKTKSFSDTDAGIGCESLTAENHSEIIATGVTKGVCAFSDVTVENSTLTAKATASGTTKTEAKLKQEISALYAEGKVDLAGGTLKCYAYATSGKFTVSALGSSAAITAQAILCQGDDNGSSYLYASNTGKYGVGILTGYLGSYASADLKSTIKAYAKNRGAGIYLANEGTECINTNITAYGGKYAIRSLTSLGGCYFEGGSLYAYAKNKYGTRTGHGIYSDGAVYFEDMKMVKVYSKKTSGYYGIKGRYVAAVGNSLVKVYAYKSKAIKSTAANSVWYPAPARVYINNVKKKSTAAPDFS